MIYYLVSFLEEVIQSFEGEANIANGLATMALYKTVQRNEQVRHAIY